MYPPFYKLIGSITLIPKENIKTIDMLLQQTVLELGRIPCQLFPPLNTLIKLQRNPKIINNRYPANLLENDQGIKMSNLSYNLSKIFLKNCSEQGFKCSKACIKIWSGNYHFFKHIALFSWECRTIIQKVLGYTFYYQGYKCPR